LSASRQIDQAISIARQSTAIRADLEPARRFLDELAANPEATLPDPGEPIIENLEPRVIKPLPDGSNNFRTGPEQPFVPPPDPAYEAWLDRLRASGAEHLNLPPALDTAIGCEKSEINEITPWSGTFMPSPLQPAGDEQPA